MFADDESEEFMIAHSSLEDVLAFVAARDEVRRMRTAPTPVVPAFVGPYAATAQTMPAPKCAVEPSPSGVCAVNSVQACVFMKVGGAENEKDHDT